MTGKKRDGKGGNHPQYFALLSRTIEELNDFPPDADIWAFIAATLKQIVPEGTIILVNSFDPDTGTITLHAVEGLGTWQRDVEAILGRPLNGLAFSVPDRILPPMRSGECHGIPGGLSELTFGCLPRETCEKIEGLPFFGKVYSAGISWKGRLKGAASFILPPGTVLENRDRIRFFIRLAAGFLSRREAEATLQITIADLQRKEKELRESEEKYRTLAESSPLVIYMVGRDDTILYGNNLAAQLIGLPPGALAGKRRGDIFPPEIARPQGRMLEEIFQSGIGRRYEERILTRDGTAIWLEAIHTPLVDRDGNVYAILGTSLDITARKKIEEALRESEERYRSFVQKFQGIAYQSTIDWIPVFFHGAVEEITGYTEQDFVSGNPRWDQVIYPEDLEVIRVRDTENLITVPGFHTLREYRIIRKDGQVRYLSDFIQNQADENGNLLLSGIITDITERKNVEETLRQKTVELEEFFSVALDLLCIANTDGYFLVLNPEWERVLGYSREELMEKRFLEFVHPVDLKPTMDAISTLVNQKEVVNFVNRYRCKDGTYRWIEWRSAPAGNLIYAAARDITERREAEQALAESEERFRLLYEKSMDAILLTSPDGAILAANPAACTMFQQGEEELLKSGRSLVVDTSDPRLAVALEERARTGRFEGELTFLRKGGTRFPGEISSSIFTDRNGNKRSSMIIRDISERRQAEHALAESEERYRKLAESTNDIIFIHDRDGIFRYMNRTGAQMIGIPAGELVGKKIADIFPPPIASRQMELVAEAFASAQPVHSELEIPIQGIVHWFDTRIIPLMAEDGTVSAVMGTVHDITERKQAADALKASEELFRLSIDKAPEAIFLFDVHENRYVEANAQAEQLFGCSRRQLLDHGPQQFYKPEQPDRRPAGETIAEHRRRVLAGETIIFERYIRNARGEDLVIEVRLVQLHSAGRMLIRSSFIDITERKHAEEALRLANKKLNLLSGITRHDIRNQLLVLSGFLEISKQSLGDPARITEFIAKEERIARIIGLQISFTKDYEDLGVKAPEWQNITSVITKVITHLPMRGIHVDTGDPDLEVLADPLLEKVFYNLIDNALRYGGEQMTSIRVTTRKDNGNLVISVKDDGEGISAEDKKKLFTRGFGKNTGLGLYLSREILSITGITITENGEPGKGARFGMTVPKGAFRFPDNKS